MPSRSHQQSQNRSRRLWQSLPKDNVTGLGPIRTCIACRRKANPAELLRIGRTRDGRIALGIRDGRGAYVCPNTDCASKALEKDRLGRSLRAKVEASEKETIRTHLWDKLR